jgi:hypothetical protein
VRELSLPVHQRVLESNADAFEKEAVLHARGVAEVVRAV